MSFDTSANPTTISERTSVPSLSLLQVDAATLGNLTDSVNLFRGAVVLPIELVRMEARGGLEVRIALTYDSNVRDQVDTWNLEAPTGVAGVGWSLPFELIMRDDQGGVAVRDSFYLVRADGSRTALTCFDRSGPIQQFEAADYRFEQITYQPATDAWQIVGSDGVVRSYGGDAGSRQTGVSWSGPRGGWTDGSVRPLQAGFTSAWNLSRLANVWGDAIRFEYDRDDQPIGTAGLRYTRACYLARILDPSGRVITLGYEAKRYTDTIKEYEWPHLPSGGVIAYQDRFMTRYLAAISITQDVAGTPVGAGGVRLLYSLDNLATAPGDPVYLTKRYLRGVAMIAPGGATAPGLRFDYGASTGAAASSNPGALTQITYPQGAIARYGYDEVVMPGTSRDLTLGRGDLGSGVPRIWIGPSYIVLACYSRDDARRLTVHVFDWNGSWIQSRPLVTSLDGDLDLTTLEVALTSDWFLFSFRARGAATGDTIETYAITRELGRFGDWAVVRLAMPELRTSSSTYQVTAGDDFVAAAAQDVRQLYRYAWDPRSRTWQPGHQDLDQGGQFVLAGRGSLMAMCQYLPDVNQAALTLYGLDPVSRTWTTTALDDLAPILWDPKLPKLSWSMSDDFAVATYLTAQDLPSNTVSYAVAGYLWDRDRVVVSRDLQQYAGVPAGTIEPFFVSIASGSVVGNVGNLRRFDGGTWSTGQLGSFTQGAAIARFAYGVDLAIGSDRDHSVAAAYDPVAGGFVPRVSLTGGVGPMQPTIGGAYVTIRAQVYYRRPSGELASIYSFPNDATGIANSGPFFIAYGQADGSSLVYLLQNGGLGPSVKLASRLFPEVDGPGTVLTGPSAFAVYTGPSFDAAQTITLCRVVNQGTTGAISHRIVRQVSVTDGLGATRSTTYRYVGNATTGAYGLVGQYAEVDALQGTGDVVAAPYGYTKHRYYNGLVPAGSPTELPYAELNGVLRQVTMFDDRGRAVSDETYDWEVVREIRDLQHGGAPLRLIGAYARNRQQASTVYDPARTPALGLTYTTTLTYDDGVGLPATRTTVSYQPDGTARTRVETTAYGYTQYPALLATNQLAVAIAQRTTVDDATVALEATTWKAWTGAAGPAWAPYRSYRARAADAALTASDWAGTTVPPDAAWWQVLQIERRDLAGNALETIGGDGIASSVVYDRSARFVVVSARNASLAGQQLSSLSFAPYEDLQGWTLDGSAAALTAAIHSGDGCPGAFSVTMPPATTSHPLACQLAVAAPSGLKMLFTSWVKTSAGLGAGAAWTLTAGAQIVTLPVVDTGGAWQQIYAVLDLPASAGAQAVTLAFENRADLTVRIGSVCWAPVLAQVDARQIDPIALRPVAAASRAGAVARTLYDDLGAVVTQIRANEAPIAITARYQSRQGNAGLFAAADPNAVLAIRPHSWAFHQRFDLGDAWRTGWTGDFARWTPGNGALVHQAGATDQLRYGGVPAGERFGLQVRARPVGLLAGALGVVIGDALSITWSPVDAAWRLRDAGVDRLIAPRTLLAIAYAGHAATLDAGQLPADLPGLFEAEHGYPLAADSGVTVVTAQVAWRIADGRSALVYYLVRSAVDPSTIVVTLAPRLWTVLVDGDRLAMFADGGRVLGYRRAAGPITGAPGILASDAVGFDDLALFAGQRVELDFQDATGQLRQQQVLDRDGVIATATIVDALGRAAITSQSAVLAPADDAWLTYAPDLAMLDWQTLTMTGTVADQNPDSGRFAYARSRFESSPLGRLVELGLPGDDFAITGASPHTALIKYALSDGAWGYAAGKFFARTHIDPDGITSTVLTDLDGNVVCTADLADAGTARWNVTRRSFDPAGRLSAVEHPIGTRDDFRYDFLGKMTSSRYAAEAAATLYAYDRAGRLRFTRPPNGAGATPYYRFLKLDVLARVIAQGCYAHDWSGLQPDDPAFPPAPAMTELSYDGLARGDLRALGRVSDAISQHQVAGPGQADPFVATERYFYNLAGDPVRTTVRAEAYQAVDYAVDYTFGNLGEVTRMVYPARDGSAGTAVDYRYDRAGRVADVIVDGTAYVGYRYGGNGKLIAETLHGAGVDFQRSHRWNPPGWQTGTSDPIFSETIDYTTGRADDGGGYYNGSPARITTQPRGSLPVTARRFGYDLLGRLTTVADGAATASYGYDANANLATFTTATLGRDGDRLTRRTQGASAVDYHQDADGETTAADATVPDPSVALSYDWLYGMPLSGSVVTLAGTIAQAVRYGYKARRLYQRVTDLDGTVRQALYIRGLGGEPLVVFGDSAADTAAYVHSPVGPALLIRGGTPYFVTQDYLGSIRGLFDLAGALVAGYDYDVYGSDLQAPFGPSPALSRFRYTGRELDVTGLYDFLARLYDPAVGGFTSIDPRHQFSSPYVYVGGNPLRFRDPSGEVAWLLFILIGALIGGTVGSIQAGIVISRKHLTGGKAAGVFFGFLGLGLGAGALAGAGVAAGAAVAASTGAAVTAATLTAGQATAINIGTGLVAGVVTGTLAGAGQSAGQTALLGGDAGKAARNGAAVGALGGAITGAFNGAGLAVNFARAAAGGGAVVQPTAAQIGLGLLGGSVAGVAQAGLGNALNGGSSTDLLVGVLQGLAFGALQQAGRLFSIRANATVQPVPPGGPPPGGPPPGGPPPGGPPPGGLPPGGPAPGGPPPGGPPPGGPPPGGPPPGALPPGAPPPGAPPPPPLAQLPEVLGQ
jgi:large repetitive protein